MKYFFLMILATTILSCKKQAVNDDSLVQYNITTVAGPDIGSVGQPMAFTVSYPYSNGCQGVDTFKEEPKGDIIVIKAFGHYDKNAICTQDAGIRSKTYPFTPPSKGTFILRFTSIDNTYVSHTITIN